MELLDLDNLTMEGLEMEEDYLMGHLGRDLEPNERNAIMDQLEDIRNRMGELE